MRNKAKTTDSESIVSQRLKRAISIIKKLERSERMCLTRMQDIGGCRAIVSNIESIYKLQSNILDSKIIHSLIKTNDYIENLKLSGYRGLHLIYNYRNQGQENHNIYNNLCIEVQIRSKVKHTWATTVEIIDTFTGQDLKSNGGLEEWKIFFKMNGDLFFISEFSKFKSYDIYQIGSLRRKITELIYSLQVIEKLTAFSVTSKDITRKLANSKKWEYILMFLNIQRGYIELTYFKRHESEEAMNKYKKLEKQYINNSNIDVVLISLESIVNLQKAYPNYFADSEYFIHFLKRVTFI